LGICLLPREGTAVVACSSTDRAVAVQLSSTAERRLLTRLL
jgi:hypothetical protein